MYYPTNPMEQLSNQELESIAEYEHPIQSDSIQNIQGRFAARVADARAADAAVGKTAKGTSRKKFLVIAAVAAAVVFLFGFTNANRIYELYYQYFGEGAQIAKYVSEIGEIAYDQGFKMEVLSAVNDGESTYLFVDITDETGDRLSDDVSINRWKMTGSRPLGGGGMTLVEYNPATKTATFAVHSISAKPGDSVLFRVSSFMSGANDYRVVADTIDLTKLLTEHEGQFVAPDNSEGCSGGTSIKFHDEGKTLRDVREILKLDAIDIALPDCDKAWISNIAYRDDKLHVQLRVDNNRGYQGASLSLVHKNTGDELGYYYSINAGQRNVDGLADHEEFVFEIARDRLKDYHLLVEGFYYTQVFDGSWEVGFQVPERMDSKMKQVNTEVRIGGKAVKVESVEVSPVGVTIKMQDRYQVKGELNISLTYQDGSTMPIHKEEINTLSYGEDSFRFILPIRDFKNVGSLTINGVVIDF